MRQQKGRWLAPFSAIFILIVAFQSHSSYSPIKPANGLQQPGGHVEHGVDGPTGGGGAPLMSPVEASSALESSGALVADDLIAAESSQAPDAPAEHKAFTQSAPMMRQVSVFKGATFGLL